MPSTLSPEALPAWASLQDHAVRLQTRTLPSLFVDDVSRFDRLSRNWQGLTLDLSRQRLDPAALDALLALATEAGLAEGIRAFFGGEAVNHTEGRPALHMALRGSCAAPAGAKLDQRPLRAFAAALRAGQVAGATDAPITRVINIGIGGSDLGPRLVAEALRSTVAERPVAIDFVANIDPRDLEEALEHADAASTLFIVSSKSFGTAETLANAQAGRDWLRARLPAGADVSRHFAAVSNATAAAAEFGIDPARTFALPEWVGGRYSLWSAIGLPLLVGLGEEAFDRLLAGARALDEHFRDTPFADNLPVLMGLVGLWNTDFLGLETLAVLPYAHGLRNFPAWLQQLEMESNGKRTLRDGSSTTAHTSPIVWGGVGTVGQHAFHQLFYQGTRSVPMDFIVPVGDDEPRQRGLVGNAFAQAAALMHGRDIDGARTALRARGLPEAEVERLAPHLVCPGNQSSTTLLMPRLDAFHLGQLLALYEHKVFVQGWIWGINSFDQYGVELGKEMARRLADAEGERDATSASLMAIADALRGG